LKKKERLKELGIERKEDGAWRSGTPRDAKKERKRNNKSKQSESWKKIGGTHDEALRREKRTNKGIGNRALVETICF